MSIVDCIKKHNDVMMGIDEHGYATTFRIEHGCYLVPMYSVTSTALSGTFIDEWDVIESVPERRNADFFRGWACHLTYNEADAVEMAARNHGWYINSDEKQIFVEIEYTVLGDK